jgi:hypothetical protein
MRKIIVFIIISLIIISGIILSFIKREGYLDIIFLDSTPSKVIINDNDIIGIENRYLIKTDYGPINIKIYYEDNNIPTSLKMFHENNWYKSRMKIGLNNNVLEIKYIEDLTKILEYGNVSVEIGQEIIFSWLD